MSFSDGWQLFDSRRDAATALKRLDIDVTWTDKARPMVGLMEVHGSRVLWPSSGY